MSAAPPGPLTQAGELRDWLRWAVAQQPAKKNEDRFVVTSAAWADCVAAVLDGHNGRLAAETCCKRLVPLISEELAKLEQGDAERTTDLGGESTSADWHPHLEAAITAAFKRLDKDIRAAVPDGTTAGVVILKRCRDGGVAAKCAWVGDSRALLVTYDPAGKAEVRTLSRDHKATDAIEAARIEAFYQALERVSIRTTAPVADLKGEADCSGGSGGGSGHGESSRRGADAALLAQARADFGPKSRGDVSSDPRESPRAAEEEGCDEQDAPGTSMTEEVSASFGRAAEFDPTMLGLNVSRDSGGAFVVNLPPRGRGEGSGSGSRGGAAFHAVRTGLASEGGRSEEGSGGGSVENSRHGPTPLGRARVEPPPRAPVPPPPPPPPPAPISAALAAAAEAAAAEVPIRGRRSFVGRLRDASTGNMSNPRLFGGSVGASTAMTRSIGDRGAARCCIAEPEFLTLRCEPGARARVIIASDGVWDVYSNEEAETIAKGTRMDGARSGAQQAALLARRAMEDRSFDGLAPDDITVVLLDVLGGPCGAGAGAGGGSCCAVQ